VSDTTGAQPDAYARAGVDIAAGDDAARRYQAHAARTWRPEVLTALGGFGGAFALPIERYPQPLLVSGTDGVGTKLKLAFALNQHDTVGVDCVAMCVNDIAVMGAEPLFFLDYFATGKLDPAVAERVVAGVADGCTQAGCALIGGETAEMPGMYADGEYDLAGFAVGIVNRDKLIDGSAVTAGDVVIGLGSSGVHSNGFSLVRHLIADARLDLAADAAALGQPGTSIGAALLTPTRIYARTLPALAAEFPIHGMAHITGGGLTENLPRVLHGRWDIELALGSWDVPPVFGWLADLGALSDDTLFRTFNMGVGLALLVPESAAAGVLARAAALGERAARIGVVVGDSGTSAPAHGDGGERGPEVPAHGTGQVRRAGSWR
jgi:phosphoribosylformylglycinamidine cyclo-ligase